MSEIIVVTSGKGGVGKTTVTANLGLGLAKMNKKVVVVDTDIGLRNLDVVLGLENRIVYNLIDVIEGNRVYMPCLYVLNKIDQISIEELDILAEVCPVFLPLYSSWSTASRSAQAASGTSTSCSSESGSTAR